MIGSFVFKLQNKIRMTTTELRIICLERFEGVCANVPTLEEILNEVNIMAESDTGDECYDPLLVIEVLLPMAGT